MTAQPLAASDSCAAPLGTSSERDFRILWAGQSLSLLGDNFMVLALPLLAVRALGWSESSAALLPFAMTLPFLLFGLPAGALVDRLRLRPLMIACDALQGLLFLVIAILGFLKLLPLWLLMILLGVIGVATLFFQVAYTSYLPELYSDPGLLQRGNARLFLSESVTRALGPALAGRIVALLGPVAAVAANSGSFAISVLSLLAIRTRPQAPRPVKQREPGWLYQDIKEGLKFVLAHPQIEPVLSCGACYVLFLSILEATLVLYCQMVLKLSTTETGIVIGAAALGYPLGNLASPQLIARLGIPKSLVAAACVSVCGLVLIPIAGGLGSTVGLVSASILHGVGEGTFGPTSQTLRQLAAPKHLLGRVNSVQRFLLWGMAPIGSLLASLIVKLHGLTGAVLLGGLGTVLCLPLLLRRGIRAALLQRAEAVSLPS